MTEIRARIYFKGNYDVDAVDELLYEEFDEADQWYNDCCIRFHGTPERFQELVRAIKTIEPNFVIKQS